MFLATFVPKVGQKIEVSLDRALHAEIIANFIHRRNGAALIIDYGNNHPASNTLRACKKHKFEDILCEPGLLDITSDVDFQSLRSVFEKSLF